VQLLLGFQMRRARRADRAFDHELAHPLDRLVFAGAGRGDPRVGCAARTKR
jgi:hypothetical protein